MNNKFTLQQFTKVADILNWGKVPVEIAFPEIIRILEFKSEHYINNVDYYSLLCADFNDFLEYFLKPKNAFAALIESYGLKDADLQLVDNFHIEIAMSMEHGCSFVDALREWDLI